MIDKKSKNFIKWLSTQQHNRFLYSDAYPEKFGNREEFFAMVRYLESSGMIETMKTSNGTRLGIQLTHIALHNKEFSFLEFLNYLKDKWVDILALIISFLALFGAYRDEINAIIQKLVP